MAPGLVLTSTQSRQKHKRFRFHICRCPTPARTLTLASRSTERPALNLVLSCAVMASLSVAKLTDTRQKMKLLVGCLCGWTLRRPRSTSRTSQRRSSQDGWTIWTQHLQGSHPAAPGASRDTDSFTGSTAQH